jgi:hypothetical protein
MPTKREREYYSTGYRDGYEAATEQYQRAKRRISRSRADPFYEQPHGNIGGTPGSYTKAPKPKRKLSAWNKYVKANSKKPRFRYRDGKLNLKKMAVAFRKTPAGKKKRR